MKYHFLFSLLALLFTHVASAQEPVAAPQKDGEYTEKNADIVVTTGMCRNGYKTGTWKYYTDYGQFRREERYDDNGFLVGRIARNGSLWEDISLKNGERHGLYRASWTMFDGDKTRMVMTGWYTASKYAPTT